MFLKQIFAREAKLRGKYASLYARIYSHDRASKGHGSIPCLMSQTDLHRISLCKHACKEVCDVKQGVDPYPLLVRSCDR